MSFYDRDYARESDNAGGRHIRFGPAGVASGYRTVTILIAVNIAVFLFDSMSHFRLSGFGAMRSAEVLQGQLWRLITSQYLHASPAHILMNMIGLYFLGEPLEQRWGRRKFLWVYTLAGLTGNLFFMLLQVVGWANWSGAAVGASGCILGLLGAAAVLFPHAEVLVYFLFPVRIRDAAIVYTLLYAYNIWSRKANFGGDAAHLAGLAFGVWFATIGDRWWTARGAGSRGWWGKWAAGRRSRRAKAASRTPSLKQKTDDTELLDRLLKKVYDSGIHSLTAQERRALAEATERQREREAAFGRVDRL